MTRSIEMFLAPWQAADYSGLKIEAIYELLESGEIAGKNVHGRWIIKKSALDEWLDAKVSRDELKKLENKISSFKKEEVEQISKRSQTKGDEDT